MEPQGSAWVSEGRALRKSCQAVEWPGLITEEPKSRMLQAGACRGKSFLGLS